MKCMLIYSTFIGITTREELLSPDNKVKSTYYIDSFGDFALEE